MKSHAEEMHDLIREIALANCHKLRGKLFEEAYIDFLTLHAFLNEYVILKECPWNIGRAMNGPLKV